MLTKVVDVEDAPRWQRLIAWVSSGYLERSVVIQEEGGPVAILLDVNAANLALAIGERLKERRPPFTQAALDKWVDEVLSTVDVSALLSGDPQPDSATPKADPKNRASA